MIQANYLSTTFSSLKHLSYISSYLSTTFSLTLTFANMVISVIQSLHELKFNWIIFVYYSVFLFINWPTPKSPEGVLERTEGKSLHCKCGRGSDWGDSVTGTLRRRACSLFPLCCKGAPHPLSSLRPPRRHRLRSFALLNSPDVAHRTAQSSTHW